MSIGLQALIEAANYVEQQEQLKLSPQPAEPAISISSTFCEQPAYILNHHQHLQQQRATPTILNGIRSNHHITSSSVPLPSSNSASSLSPTSNATNHHFHHHQQQQQQQQSSSTSSSPSSSSLLSVSSSAPAATSIFHHRSGSGLNVTSFNGQLAGAASINGNGKHKSDCGSSAASAAAASTGGAGRAGSMTGGSPNQLLVHSVSGSSEDSHMSCVSGSSSGTSPPRQYSSSNGNHFLHITGGGSSNFAATNSGSQNSLHSGSGRRRTISSNSNGAAGTREVHNKLEKNRRAHLKECYEQLKNQLPLRDEERKKTSNLAILSEALKHVVALKQQDKELEVEVEQLAKDKINAQKKILSLKRELGPRFEQIFGNTGMSPDLELSSIPIERENLNDSLSSGHGSMLYSSSSSLSSGGSSGSNAVSSPVSAGYQQQLQTGMETAMTSVINQNMQQQQQQQKQHATKNSTCATSKSIVVSTSMPLTHTTIYEHAVVQNAENADNQQRGQVTNVVNVSSMPLSLTAKNISATSLTRGSPTPSTPSPSPSSSSGISSSSSLISSSPPMNGASVINGIVAGGALTGATVARNVTVNISNGMKFQALNTNNTAARGAATIITTTPVNGGGGSGGGNNSHNAIMLQAFRGCHLA